MTKQTSRREILRLLAATGAMVVGCSSDDDAIRDPSNGQPQNADVESSGEDASFTRPAQDASPEANDAGPTTPTLDGTWANLTPAGEVFVDFIEKHPVG